MATAPQNATRQAPLPIGAPPARAETAPNAAKKTMADTVTPEISLAWGAKTTTTMGSKAPTEKLAAAGVDVELIDLRTLRPMDSATVIESVKKTGRIVTVEEGWPQGGIGAELCARVVAEAFDYLDAPPTRVTGKDVPMPYAANLEKLALPHVDDVVAAVNAVTYRS